MGNSWEPRTIEEGNQMTICFVEECHELSIHKISCFSGNLEFSVCSQHHKQVWLLATESNRKVLDLMDKYYELIKH